MQEKKIESESGAKSVLWSEVQYGKMIKTENGEKKKN